MTPGCHDVRRARLTGRQTYSHSIVPGGFEVAS